jgi:serine/threonine-protein kinase
VRHRYQAAGDILRALDLEPYLDSLRDGLANKPNSPQNPTLNGNSLLSGDFNLPSSPSSPSSATSKLAMAIRARRAKQEQSGPNTAAGQGSRAIPRPGASATSLKSEGYTVGKPKVPVKLDADGLLMAYLKGRRDFASQDLIGLNLQKAELSGGIFHQAKLAKVNFHGANLSNADFGRASLNRANLRDANLGRAYLSYADLEGADLRGADLSYAYLNHANLKGANLCGANLTNAKITEEQLALAKTNWATVLPSGKRGFW